jgi:hypothetical protein
MNFINLCLNEDINGLTELKKKGFNVVSNNKMNALKYSIMNGKLSTLKWLYNNSIININGLKLVKLAIISNQIDIIFWLCNHYKIHLEDIKSIINKPSELLLQIKDKINNIKIKFAYVCSKSKADVINKYYIKNKYFLSQSMIDEIVFNEFTFECIKWAISNNLYANNRFLLIKKSIIEDKILIFKWLYDNLKCKLLNIIKLPNIDKKSDIYKYYTKCAYSEIKYYKLLELCKKELLDKVQLYYLDNIVHIVDQIKIRNINEILNVSKYNIDVFDWFSNLYKISKNDIENFIKDGIQTNNFDLIFCCKNKLTSKEIKKIDIDSLIFMVNDFNLGEMVLSLINFGFKFRNDIDELIERLFLLGYDNVIVTINNKYNYFKNGNNKLLLGDLMIDACENYNTTKIKFLYSLNPNIFENKFDELYEQLVSKTFSNCNNQVLEWLLGLYDRFYVVNDMYLCDKLDNSSIDSSDDEHFYDDSSDEYDNSVYNEIYDIVLENKNSALELLGITKVCTNTNNDNCIICKDTPDDLIKLNCNHFGCLSCLATWYKDNKEICVYCKNDIIWSECELVNFI